ncbi:MAG: hypothetical protein AB7R69_05050 [Candidatus Babeliales bacterium]
MKKLFYISFFVALGIYAQEDSMFSIIKNPKTNNYNCRVFAANKECLQQPNYDIYNEHNGDDDLAAYAGSFTKGLEHDAATGLLTANGQLNYQRLLTALYSGLQEDFNAIQRAGGRKFVNPQSAFARSLVGTPAMITPMPLAFNLSSAEAAADMIEVYLQMICRSVNFEDYGTGANTDVDTINGGSLTNNAAAILTALGSAYKGPSNNGTVTAAELFRGNDAGNLVGPYISQFWFLPNHRVFQADIVQNQYIPIAQNRQFGVSFEDFVEIQNGNVPKPYQPSDFSGQRLIICGKDAGTTVHMDSPVDFCNFITNILLFYGAPLSPVLPYSNGSAPNEEGFVTFLVGDIYNAIGGAMEEAFKNAWAHKWLGNRRLRPEAMAGLVHNAQTSASNPYNLDASLFASYTTPAGTVNLLDWVRATNQLQAGFYTGQSVNTYLLALLFPEGSPLHPSYPQGHSTVAGSCKTIIKAFFDDQALISSFVTPMKPDPADPTQLIALTVGEGANLLTVGGELDKIAANVGQARNFAGVHYRSETQQGNDLGEAIAIKYLQDFGRIYHESGFTGFVLTKGNGQRIRITPEAVTVITP